MLHPLLFFLTLVRIKHFVTHYLLSCTTYHYFKFTVLVQKISVINLRICLWYYVNIFLQVLRLIHYIFIQVCNKHMSLQEINLYLGKKNVVL